MLFLSLSKWRKLYLLTSTAGTVVLLKGDLDAEPLSVVVGGWGGESKIRRTSRDSVLTAGFCHFHVSEVGREGVNAAAHSGSLLR